MRYSVITPGKWGGQGKRTEVLGTVSRGTLKVRQKVTWRQEAPYLPQVPPSRKGTDQSSVHSWQDAPFLCRCTRGHICDGACPPSSAAAPVPPVALAYTTLAWGSLLCRSSTALPILVELAFLALWHSSNTIWDMVG